MKLLLTGATGFVGRHLLHALNTGEHRILCLTRKPPARVDDQNLVFLPYTNAQGAADWQQAFQDCDAVIHLAGRAHILQEDAADPLAAFRAVNVDQTLLLAREAMARGVKRFIYVSSVKVNGERTLGQPFRSSDTPAPEDAYGRSKCEAEQQLFKLAQGKMEIVIVRPPLVYGPGVKANFLHLMQAVQRGIPLPFGAIENRRSLIFVGNLVDLLMTCLHHPKAANQIWMASDNHDLSTPALVRLLGEALQVPARLISVPPRLLNLLARLAGKQTQAEKLLGSLQVDIQPTLQELDWKPPYSVQQGLLITTRAWKNGMQA